MTLSSDGEGAGSKRAHSRAGDGADDGGWSAPTKPDRDIKKLALVIGLGVLSWVATYVGMLELIEANMGALPLVHKAIIGFSVGMLMTMIVWLLDQLFQPIGLFTKVLYAAGYVFLTVISVGFGFGFYWKVLESRSESSRSAESAVSQVQGSLNAASTRLEQLQSTLVQLTQVSQQKAESERATGLSCPNSKPGDGPRRKMREDDAARFGFASEFVKGRVGAVKGDIATLDTEFAKIAKDDKSTVDAKSGTRNEFMKGLSRRLDMTVTSFNAFRTDPQLKQIRMDLADRAEKVSFIDTKGATYTCPDQQLQMALRGVVRAIDQLPEMEKPRIAAVEGSEATIEAFRRLTATFYGALAFKMPPSADELRQLQQKAIQSVEGGAAQTAKLNALAEQAGLSKRDYVPLAIAIFVDICLLLVSMGRSTNRLHGLVPKMQAAEKGPVYQILSKFSDIHKDPETREKFEIFRHVVFDFNGDYYVAVPLNAPVKANPQQKIELQLEAHLLANLFSSFEKERIFSRVHSPFLTTGTIQKKLWRQGSKFAGSEAFRIYRFRDGAWSDIILGAVMGASRRVDSEKRRRVHEEGHALPIGERGQPHDNQSADRSARSQDTMWPAAHNSQNDDGTYHGQDPRHFDRSPAAGHDRARQPRTDAGHRNGHAYATGQTGYSSGRVSQRTTTDSTRRSTARADIIPTSDPEALARQFGRYAGSLDGLPRTLVTDTAVQPATPPSANYREMAEALDAVNQARRQVGEAEVSVMAANNNNTMPPPRPQRTEPRVAETSQVWTPQATPAVMPAAMAAPMPTASAPAIPMSYVEPHPAAAAAQTPNDNVVPMPRFTGSRAAEEAVMMTLAEPIQSSAAHFSPAGDMIDVTVQRETATFRVPVSEARLPRSLEAMLGQAITADHGSRRVNAIEVEATPAMIEKIAAAVTNEDARPANTALTVVHSAEVSHPTQENRVDPLPLALPRYAGQPAE